MRAVKPGSIQEVVRDAISVAGGLECASNDLGLAVSSLSRASSCDEDRPGGLGVNHLHRLGRIVPQSAEPVAVHFARLAGGVFQPLPVQGALRSNIHDLTKEFSDVLSVHAKAHSEVSSNPDDFTRLEAQAAIKEVDELVQAAMAYRAALHQRAGE
ncbi:hypothetical protein QEZ52_00425 [Aliisedimentitalea scapharcae]|uniref:Uncharacterized protein n=1 Tax=Aliisedimentitalea scapharcae TaxID=1524259 RepID=A0ABZ2XUN7_9RHOB